MKSEYSFSSTLIVGVRGLVAILCIGALVPGNAFAQSQQAPPATSPAEQSSDKASTRSTRLTGGADRAVSRSAAQPDSGGFHVSA